MANGHLLLGVGEAWSFGIKGKSEEPPNPRSGSVEGRNVRFLVFMVRGKVGFGIGVIQHASVGVHIKTSCIIVGESQLPR